MNKVDGTLNNNPIEPVFCFTFGHMATMTRSREKDEDESDVLESAFSKACRARPFGLRIATSQTLFVGFCVKLVTVA